MIDQFKEMYQRYLGNNPNPNENIQRVEITSIDIFDTLKNSGVTFDTTFYNDHAKVVGQKDFVDKVFLHGV